MSSSLKSSLLCSMIFWLPLRRFPVQRGDSTCNGRRLGWRWNYITKSSDRIHSGNTSRKLARLASLLWNSVLYKDEPLRAAPETGSQRMGPWLNWLHLKLKTSVQSNEAPWRLRQHTLYNFVPRRKYQKYKRYRGCSPQLVRTDKFRTSHRWWSPSLK